MPQFRLIIDLGNDAMCLSSDIAEALIQTSKHIPVMYDGVMEMDRHNILDRNGNIVGHYEVVDS